MKFISNNKHDLDYIKQKCMKYEIVDEHIIQHVEQEQGNNIALFS